MLEKSDLRDVERRVFASRFQDGLLEISISCVLFMFALGPFLSPYLGDFWSSAVFLPFWALAAMALALTRRYVVLPRLGTVEYGRWRRDRMLRFNTLAVLLGILALALGFLSVLQFDAIPGWMHVARLSLIALLGFGLAGLMLGLKRLYLYGLLVALAPWVGELLHQAFGVPHHGFPLAFGATAAALLALGVSMLIRLIRRHPSASQPTPSQETAA